MGSRGVKVVGGIIGLIGLIWAIIRLYESLGAMFTLMGSSGDQLAAGWLLFVLLLGWIISIIGVALGLVTSKAGGGWLLASGALFLLIWLFCYFSSPQFNPIPSTYNFIDTSLDGTMNWFFPLEAILFFLGGLIVLAGRD